MAKGRDGATGNTGATGNGATGNGAGRMLLAVTVLVVGVAMLERLTRPLDGGATEPLPLPPLLVEGWLNTDASSRLSPEALRGRWVVVDFWATWCPPCVRAIPELVKLNDRWRDRGVSLVGLTPEGKSEREAIVRTVDRFDGVVWPVGYGAVLLQEQLSIEMYPTLILFDRDGRSVWRGHTVAALERQLEERVSGTGG